MHILKWELKANRKGLIIWSVIILVLIFMMTTEYSAYHDNPDMQEIMDAIPEQMLKAFSMQGTNLTTPSGFISLASFYFYLLLGIHAIVLGTGIIAKEERDKTAEFFLTMPITREEAIMSKLTAAIINCLILLAVTIGGVIITLLRYEPGREFYEFLGYLTIALFMIQMIFLSVGMFLSSILKRYKTSGKIGTFLLVGLYFVSMITSLSDKVDFLKYLTPFKYYEASNLLNNMEFELRYIIITIVIIAIGIGGTFFFYPKRDLMI